MPKNRILAVQNDGRQKTAPPLAFSGGIGYDTKESYTNQEVNGNERRMRPQFHYPHR